MQRQPAGTPGQSLPEQAGRLCAGLLIATLAARATSDPDLWGHLRFGLDVMATGALTRTDPYSFTQDVPWINHEWLSELLFAAAYRVGGVAALVLLKSLLIGTMAWLLWPIARRAAPTARWWLLAVSIFGTGAAAATFRPQLWTLVGIAVVVRVLVERRSPLWLLPVFAVWANLHGGWIVGGGVFAMWTLGRAFDARSVRAVAPLVATGVAAFAVTVANPYGWHLWQFLFATVRMQRNVTEWLPLWQQESWGHAVTWALVAAVVLAAFVRRWSQLSWASVLPVVWLGASGLFVDRLAMLFAEVAVMVTSEAWASDDRTVRVRGRGFVVIDLSAFAALWLAVGIPTARCLPMSGTWVPDLAVARAFSAPAASGRLVLPFDWGQYAIWHWGPRLRVSTDGRRETVYREETVEEQASIVRGEAAGLDFLVRERPEYVWLPSQSHAAAAALRQNGYRLDAESPRSFIATRSDLPVLTVGQPMSACFP